MHSVFQVFSPDIRAQVYRNPVITGIPFVCFSNALEYLANDLGMLVGLQCLKKPSKGWGSGLTDVLPALGCRTRKAPGNRAGLFLHLREACLLQGSRKRPALGEGKWGRGARGWGR